MSGCTGEAVRFVVLLLMAVGIVGGIALAVAVVDFIDDWRRACKRSKHV